MDDRRLPPLAALRIFEVAARFGSFTQASTKLGVSQSAVTRHIAVLELAIGVKLFHRGRRGVVLTLDGQKYFAEITLALERIEAATIHARQSGGQELLRLRVYPTFALKWLVPKLGALSTFAPTLRIALDMSMEPTDFRRSALDAAIVFGASDRSDVHVELLMADEIEPVCGPGLLKGRTSLCIDEIATLPLLYSRNRRGDWVDWAIANGRPALTDTPGLELPSSILTYKAAQDGLGIAMGHIPILQADLDEGVLIRPFRRPLRRPLGYHLLTPSDREPPRSVRQFKAWLRQMLPS